MESLKERWLDSAGTLYTAHLKASAYQNY